MQKKHVFKIDDLGISFEIHEPDKNRNPIVIYCGRVLGDGWRNPKSATAFAIKCGALTLCFLLISGAIWSYCTGDFTPFKIISEIILKIWLQ